MDFTTGHRRLLLGLTGALALSFGAAGALSARSDGPDTARQALLRVDGTLPSWVAPGARATVSGYAAAHERLVLHAGSSVLGRHDERAARRLPLPVPGTGAGPVPAAGRRRRPDDLRRRPRRAPAPPRRRRRHHLRRAGRPGRRALRRRLSLAGGGGHAAPRRHHDREPRDGDLDGGRRRRQGVRLSRAAPRDPADAVDRRVRRPDAREQPLRRLRPRSALLDTLRIVRAAGMQARSAPERTPRRRTAPRSSSAGGLTVAFLGYSDVNPLGLRRGELEPRHRTGGPRARSLPTSAPPCRRADVVGLLLPLGHSSSTPSRRAASRCSRAACLQAGRAGRARRPPPRLRLDHPSVPAYARRLDASGTLVFPSGGRTSRTGILQVQLDARGVRGYALLPVQIDRVPPAAALDAALKGPAGSYPQVAQSAVEMLIIQNPQSADFSSRGSSCTALWTT